mgnify:CR=1 FL=1
MKQVETARLSRRVLNWIPAGRRGRGRPQVIWIQDIEKAMKEKGPQEQELEEKDKSVKHWSREDALSH